MRIDPAANQPDDPLLVSVLDALSDHVCVIDGEGCIVAVNEAWLAFGLANGATESGIGLGTNYLRVCELAAAQQGPASDAAAFLRGLQSVLSGTQDRFALEYPCPSQTEERWFVAKVTRVHVDHVTRVVVAHDDVSQLRRARAELELALAALTQSEAHFHALFDTLPMGLVYQDAQGKITDANQEALRLLGLSMDQLCGRTSHDPRWSARHEDGSDFDGQDHPAMRALRTQEAVPETLMQVAVPGRDRAWLSIRAMPVKRNGKMIEVFTCFTDVSDRVALESELRTLANEDPLTGLKNRRRWMERLVEEHARFRRQPLRPYTLLTLDLDHFKSINDHHGHAAGDAVLKHVADRMRHTLRQADVAGRLGGEEFAVLLPDTDLAAALPLAERLRATLAESGPPHDGGMLTVTTSVGLAEVGVADASHEDVMQRADRALYRAKHAGRNRCEASD